MRPSAISTSWSSSNDAFSESNSLSNRSWNSPSPARSTGTSSVNFKPRSRSTKALMSSTTALNDWGSVVGVGGVDASDPESSEDDDSSEVDSLDERVLELRLDEDRSAARPVLSSRLARATMPMSSRATAPMAAAMSAPRRPSPGPGGAGGPGAPRSGGRNHGWAGHWSGGPGGSVGGGGGVPGTRKGSASGGIAGGGGGSYGGEYPYGGWSVMGAPSKHAGAAFSLQPTRSRKARPRGESRYPTSRLSVSPSFLSLRTSSLNAGRSIPRAAASSVETTPGCSAMRTSTARVHGPYAAARSRRSSDAPIAPTSSSVRSPAAARSVRASVSPVGWNSMRHTISSSRSGGPRRASRVCSASRSASPVRGMSSLRMSRTSTSPTASTSSTAAPTL